MNKPDYTKFIDWCLDQVWSIQQHLALTEYRIQMKEEPTDFTNDDTVFEITTNYPYKTAVIHWHKDEYDMWRKDKKRVIRCLLHEVLHILVQPLARVAAKRYVTEEERTDAVESLVDHLAMVLQHHFTK